jgi:hypothetical protein
MRTGIQNVLLTTLVVAGLAACSDNPTGLDSGSPVGDAPVDLSVNSDMELQVSGDDVLAEVVVEDMLLSMDSPPDGAGTPFAEARTCFRDARTLLRVGDEEGAKAQAEECRRMLLEVLIAERGEEAIDELRDRVVLLLERLEEADDEFERLADLKDKIQGLLDEADSFLADGDLVSAGERLVLALQCADRMRHRHREFIHNPETFARFAMARGVEAVKLAYGVIEEPTLKQERVLFHAEELLRRAQFAFEHGANRRAVVLARRAEGRALFAVLECERPTVEDAMMLLDLADRMIAAAEEAIGENPTPHQQALLHRAIRLRDAGAQAINTWHWRGVGLLWRAAVLAGILVPDSDA